METLQNMHTRLTPQAKYQHAIENNARKQCLEANIKSNTRKAVIKNNAGKQY